MVDSESSIINIQNVKLMILQVIMFRGGILKRKTILRYMGSDSRAQSTYSFFRIFTDVLSSKQYFTQIVFLKEGESLLRRSRWYKGAA